MESFKSFFPSLITLKSTPLQQPCSNVQITNEVGSKSAGKCSLKKSGSVRFFLRECNETSQLCISKSRIVSMKWFKVIQSHTISFRLAGFEFMKNFALRFCDKNFQNFFRWKSIQNLSRWKSLEFSSAILANLSTYDLHDWNNIDSLRPKGSNKKIFVFRKLFSFWNGFLNVRRKISICFNWNDVLWCTISWYWFLVRSSGIFEWPEGAFLTNMDENSIVKKIVFKK